MLISSWWPPILLTLRWLTIISTMPMSFVLFLFFSRREKGNWERIADHCYQVPPRIFSRQRGRHTVTSLCRFTSLHPSAASPSRVQPLPVRSKSKTSSHLAFFMALLSLYMRKEPCKSRIVSCRLFPLRLRILLRSRRRGESCKLGVTNQQQVAHVVANQKSIWCTRSLTKFLIYINIHYLRQIEGIGGRASFHLFSI